MENIPGGNLKRGETPRGGEKQNKREMFPRDKNYRGAQKGAAHQKVVWGYKNSRGGSTYKQVRE